MSKREGQTNSELFMAGYITKEEYKARVDEIYRKRRQKTKVKRTLNKIFSVALVILFGAALIALAIGVLIASGTYLVELINKGNYIEAGLYGTLVLGLIALVGYIFTTDN